MVGLSVVLEAQKSGSSSSSSSGGGSNSGGGGGGDVSKKNHPQVISKTTMLLNNNKLSPLQAHHSSIYFPTPTFLDQCFLCNQKLLPGKDIYMYK